MADMQRQPNIVLIQSDSMDGRIMGCMDHPAVHTPHMDRLAGRGALFRNSYCSSPQCVPSRSSMWSGQHVHRVEAWNNYKGLSPDSPTFQTELEQVGYAASIIGRTDHLSGRHSIPARVTAWTRAAGITLPQKVLAPAEVLPDQRKQVHERDWQHSAAASEWLRQHGQQESPFFLSVGFSMPHPAFCTSRYWFDQIDSERVTVPVWEEERHPVLAYMAAAKSCTDPLPDEEIRAIRQTYYAMVAEVDAVIGEVLETIAELGLGQTTYIICTSDHGEMNMEHGLHLKNAMYEASVRVPLIMTGPDIVPGTVVDEPVSLVDLYPTLLDMAGASAPAEGDGESLLPLLQGCAVKRQPVLAEYHSNMQNTGSFMLRKGPWKYIAYAGYRPQLFHLTDDPEEMVDRVASDPDTVRALDQELRERLDYEAVDRAAKAYDRRSFLEWRAGLDDAAYHKQMETCYLGWTGEHEGQIRDWLAQGGNE